MRTTNHGTFLFRASRHVKHPKRASRLTRFEMLENRWMLSGLEPLGAPVYVRDTVMSFERTPAVAVAPDGDVIEVTVTGSYDLNVTVWGDIWDQTTIISPAEYEVHPDVAVDGAGNFVVVWACSVGGIHSEIYFQRFTASGVPIGSETLVNIPDGSWQSYPRVAMAEDGQFVVVWGDQSSSGDMDIAYRRFNELGQPFDSSPQYLTCTADNEVWHDVAMAPSGDFVVTYERVEVYYRLFDNTGTPRASGRVNTIAKTGLLYCPSVGIDQDGDFLIAWHRWNGSDYDTCAQLYDSTGVTRGSEIQVATSEWWHDGEPQVSGGNGLFAISTVNAMVGASGVSGLLYLYSDEGEQLAGSYFGAPGAMESVGWGQHGLGMNRSNKVAASYVLPNDEIWVQAFSAPLLSSGIGLFSDGYWFLDINRNVTWDAGDGDAFSFGWSGATPIVGDWNGDGKDDVGVYANGAWFRDIDGNRQWDSTDQAAIMYYGWAGALPVVGDWNGDGTDDVGVYNLGVWFRDVNGNQVWDGTDSSSLAYLGWSGASPTPGDWNGDGQDDVGVYCNGAWFRDVNGNNQWDAPDQAAVMYYGWDGPTPVVGDWNGDGTDDVGVYNLGVWFRDLNGSNSWDAADESSLALFGVSGMLPVVGYWAETSSPLMAAGGELTAAVDQPVLTEGELRPIVTEAIARWAVVGLEASILDKLARVEFVIADLPGSYLGKAETDRIYIDPDAAGYGWFVDSTPTMDEEYSPLEAHNHLRALDSRAVDRIDLLTVVEHELGHIAGLDDLDALVDDLMSGVLGTGIRRTPRWADIDGFFASGKIWDRRVFCC